MFAKKECVAMILAGGQGSRLHVLTKKMAKPAVPFGGKYRIIDFTLSNCVNSGIDTVGVLTQYSPLVLNDYIGTGQPWDLDRLYGGVHILPPYQSNKGASWYEGTANAIYQNMTFIERYSPKYVVILSGDHIYKMNYSKMIDFHKEKQADCTIAVLNVTQEEASRFGIMNCDKDGVVYEFEEKPKHPKSTLASMGIYVFNWEVLKHHLTEDDKNKNSSKDFGKDIIPNMLRDNKKLITYPFEGYWKDVGTIESFWEANMDLLGNDCKFDLYDPTWKIYTRNPVAPPHYVSRKGKVSNSLVAEGCEIYGTTDFSVLFYGVVIEEGAIVHDSIIFPGAVVKKGAELNYAIVGNDAVVGENSKIGERPESLKNKAESKKWSVSVVGPNVKVSDNTVVKANVMVGKDI